MNLKVRQMISNDLATFYFGQRKQMQKCDGCVMDSSCSQPEVVKNMEKEECLERCQKVEACKLAIYSSDKRCQMTSCPLVYQGKFSNFTLHPMWIKTCRSGN